MIEYISEYTFQNESEIMEMIDLITQQTLLKTVIEIGTKHGGTAYLWAQLVKDQGGKVYCIDKKFGGKTGYVVYRDSKYKDYVFELEGASDDLKILLLLKTALDGKKVDLLFIDGAHDEMVAKDFQNYSQFVGPGGWVAFHDIINPSVQVGQFWNEIKKQYEHWEIILHNQPEEKRKSFSHGSTDLNGIGLIRWNQ